MADKTAAVGRKVPDFALPSTGGKPWRLPDVAGQKVVLYFYPKDNTSGCTKEGQQFAELHAEFRKAKTIVLGVSPDSLAMHDKFKAKFDFPFELLSDEQKQACALFGVWKEKSMYGKKYMGVERTTFLIDKQGRIARVFSKVKPAGHAAEVSEALKA